jgi:hypothetical protein
LAYLIAGLIKTNIKARGYRFRGLAGSLPGGIGTAPAEATGLDPGSAGMTEK